MTRHVKLSLQTRATNSKGGKWWRNSPQGRTGRFDPRTRPGGAPGSLFLSFGLKWQLRAEPASSVERSHLINGVPAPVFIDFPKLGFHSWRSSCPRLALVFPRCGQPRCPVLRVSAPPESLGFPQLLGSSQQGSQITVLPCRPSRPALSGNTPLAPPPGAAVLGGPKAPKSDF